MLYYMLAAFLPTSSYIADPFTKYTYVYHNDIIIIVIKNFIIIIHSNIT